MTLISARETLVITSLWLCRSNQRLLTPHAGRCLSKGVGDNTCISSYGHQDDKSFRPNFHLVRAFRDVVHGQRSTIHYEGVPWLGFCCHQAGTHNGSAPLHPQFNGQWTKFVDNFRRALKKSREKGADADTLQWFLLTYRTALSDSVWESLSSVKPLIGHQLHCIDRAEFASQGHAVASRDMHQRF